MTCSLALRCSAQPAQIGQTCDFTAPCDDGLFCQPGLPQRCRELKKPGEGCSVVNPCIAGASCDPCLVEGCNAPLQCNLNANDGAISEAACRQIYSPDLQAAARDTGLTMTYAVGTELAGIIGESQSFGVSYGQNGRYGCFTTLCGGLNADVSVEVFASIGFYTDFDSVGGSSFANFQEVEIIGIFNFGTTQVFPRINALPIGDLIGTEDSFGLGLSPDLLPFSAGSYLCETVLDTVMIEPDMEDLPQVSQRPASVVANAGLRFDLTSWWCSDAALCAWSEDDALGSLSSGSGEVVSPSGGAAESLGILGAACVSVSPGQNYELMAQAKTLGAQSGEASAVWYSGLECDDTVVRTDSIGMSPPDDVWRALSVVQVAPTNAQSMAIEISAERDDQTGRSSTSRLDVVMVAQTMSAATTSTADAGGGGGGGGSCGLIGLEPFLILALVRFGRRPWLRAKLC